MGNTEQPTGLPRKVPTKNLRVEVYRRIREMIYKAELKPGEAVVERQIADMLHVSRAPVREALVELENEGIVKRVGSRTRIVCEVTFRDIIEVYEVREMVEGMAARLLTPRISEEALADLRELATDLDKQGDGPDDEEIAFHERLVRECGNSRLIRFANPICFQSETWQFRDLVSLSSSQLFPRSDRQGQGAVLHGHIVDALEAGDPEKAESVARAHIREGRDLVLYKLLG